MQKNYNRKFTSLLVMFTFLVQTVSPFIVPFVALPVAYAAGETCVAGSGSYPATFVDYGGVTLDKAATFIADMDDIAGAYYDEDSNQIVFIGTSSSTVPNFNKDDLAVAIRSVIFNSTNPAVSMEFDDPNDPQANVALYFGGIENTNFGQTLINADYALKEFILGYDADQNEATSTVSGYESVFDRWLAIGPDPDIEGSVSRSWISPKTITLVEATSSDAFVFEDVVMQVESEALSENNDPAWDEAVGDFADHHTQYFDEFAEEIPSYAKTKQLAQIVGVVKWIKENQIGVDFEWAKNYIPEYVNTPEELDLVVTPVVDGYQLLGGVEYDTSNTYETDTNGTSTTLMEDSISASASSTDGIHWSFNSDGQEYEAVAVSAESFRAIGSYKYSGVDVSAPTPSIMPLELRRTYSSFAAGRDVGFGPGWSFLPASLSNTLSGWWVTCAVQGGYSGLYPYKMAATTQFGRETFTFSCVDDGYVADDARYHSTLSRDTKGTFRVETKDRSTYLFYTGTATTTDYKLIESYDIHSGDPDNFVRKYNWGSSTSTLITIQDMDPDDPIPSSSNGHNIAFGYNSSGQISSATGPGGTIRYGYDVSGDLISVTDLRGSTTTYAYHAGHLLKSVTDRTGTKLIENTYDVLHRVATQKNANAITKTLTYDEDDLKISWIDGNSRTGSEFYDEEARLIKSVDALGSATYFTYGTTTDAVTAIANALNGTSTFAYDSEGNLTSAIAPNGDKITYTWDSYNNLTQIDDHRYTSLLGSPRITKKVYDSDSNLTQSSIAGQATTTYSYTLHGQLATTTDSDGNTLQVFYNSYGLPTVARNALGKDTTYSYDSAGRIISITDPAGVETAYTYDQNGNRLTASSSVALSSFSYDANDRPISVTNPVNAQTLFSYTPSGQLATTTNPLNVSTHYFYNAYNNLIKVRDALSREKTFTYDALNRETSSQLASGKTYTMEYDAVSNPTVISQPNGTVATSTYDSLNRLVRSEVDGGITSYSYDDAGRLIVVHDQTGTTSYAYDVRDRLTQVINPFSATVGYQYDDLDNLKKITYPDDKTIQNQFNDAGQLTQQTDWTGGISSYAYTLSGSISTTTLPNGITISRKYDSANRLSDTTYRNASQTILFKQVYERDALGFITEVTESGSAASANTSAYEYDLAGRLIDAEFGSGNESYTYDVVGNMTILDSGVATTTYEYTVDDELATTTQLESAEGMGGSLEDLTISSSDESLVRDDTSTIPRPFGIYTDKTDRYETILQTSNSGGPVASVEIIKDRPEVHLKKWDGEVNLGVTYDAVQAPATVSQDGRVEWKGVSDEVHAYPLNAKVGMEDGGFEIEIYLKEKPKTNVFTFTLDGAESLDFRYQSALVDEAGLGEICTDTQCRDSEGVITVERPENVVGSYAVYHNSKQDQITNGTNYKTGKVFHIYRPKIVDAVGAEVWGEMEYIKGDLIVTVPQNFLNVAVYPVIVDPTFGYTSAGATSWTVMSNDIVANLSTAPESGEMDSISVYIKKIFSGTANLKGVMTLDSSLTILTNGVSSSHGYDNTASWETVSYSTSPSIVDSTDYDIGFISDEMSVVYYDSGSGTARMDASNSYSSPANWGYGATYYSRELSVYGTYSASSTANTAPSAPTSLLTEGSTNPTNITDPTPEFSAIYNDPDTGDSAVSYLLQVDTSTSFTSPYWNSGTTTMATTTEGTRISDITYAGSSLASSTTYYWRIKLVDDEGAVGAWSTSTASFSLAAGGSTNTAPSAPTSLETEGQTNPTDVSDSTPEFSAIYNDPDSSDLADYYQIQVDTNSSFTSPDWDSTKTLLGSSISEGGRSELIAYSGSALASSTTYYWRIKFWDDDNEEGVWSTETATFTLASGGSANSAPIAPTSLLTEGSTNPTNITDPTPEFSAIYNDPDTGDSAVSYLLQVDTSTSFTSPYWNSGTTTMATTTEGTRISDITYAGSSLASSTTYYWRIKLVDDEGAVGAWSTSTASFSLAAGDTGGGVATTTTAYVYDNSGNLISAIIGTTTKTYSWNTMGLLASTTSDGVTTVFVYDAQGNRISKTSGDGASGGGGSQGGTVIFSDTFTETSDTAFAAHTPDTGSSWTAIDISGSASSDSVEVHASTDTARGATNDSSAGVMYSADTTYSSPNYQIKFKMPTAPTIDEYLNVGLRMDGTAENGYLLEGWWGDNHDPAIYRVSNGSFTQLASYDSTDGVLFNNGDTVIAEISGNDITMYDMNDIGHVYATDSNHTSANKAAVGFGAYRNYGGDISTSVPVIDDLEVIEIGDTAIGWNNPSSSGETDSDWTNPTNAYSSNDSRVTIDADAYVGTGEQDYGDFGFSISAGDTIDGIEVRVESLTDSSGYHDLAIAVSKDNGSTWSSEKTIRYEDFDSSDGIKLAGHAFSDWGLTWSPTDLSDANFRVKVRLAGRESAYVDDLAIDHISVKVFHSAGSSAGVSTTRYVNDVLAPNALVLAETDGNNTPTRLNVWGPNGLVSTGDQATTTRYYPLTDHLGSVRFLTDSSGNVVRSYTYDPYGEVTTVGSASTTSYLYTGENLDEETNLLYLRARYYDPEIGRFISRDPLRGTLDSPLTQNPYLYAGANPVMYTDPTGKLVEIISRSIKSVPGAWGVHSFLRLTPDHPEKFGESEGYFFILGGYYEGGNLVAKRDYAFDMNVVKGHYLHKRTDPVELPASMENDTAFINAILAVYESYDTQKYSAFSVGDQYNCNNFTTTLIEGAGGSVPSKHKPSGSNPGLGESIPSSSPSDAYLFYEFYRKEVQGGGGSW